VIRLVENGVEWIQVYLTTKSNYDAINTAAYTYHVYINARGLFPWQLLPATAQSTGFGENLKFWSAQKY